MRCRGSLRALVLAVAAGAGVVHAQGPAPERDFVRLRAALHIHTTYSTGDESIRQVAERARDSQLDVLVFTDDDLLKVAYGLPPLRRLLRVTREYRSLLGEGSLQAYLDEIRQVDAEFEDLILIDGVESAPYYWWTTDLGQRLWTVNDWNRHLLAVGLEHADAYRQLPILGGGPRTADWTRGLWTGWPLAGLVYAVWLGRGLHSRRFRHLVAVGSLLFLADGALQHQQPEISDPYRWQGTEPYQAYIDAVRRAGGLAFWAHPEAASTIPAESVAGVLRVQSHTPPHAQDLIDTDAYTGFAALYADNVTATEPGRHWDRVLTDYLAGARSRPAWGTGEIDYHGPGEGIGDIQTVLWARERSRAGALEALAAGRSYAVRGGASALVLERFALRAGRTTAVPGERARVGAAPWRVTAVVGGSEGASTQVHVRLVRGEADGTVRVVADARGSTPLRVERVEESMAAGGFRYYRLLASAPGSRLTSNPVFAHGAGG